MKTDKKIKKYWGYKLFKQITEDLFEIIRIIAISDFNNMVVVRSEETGATKKVRFETLKDYTPLEPFGVVAFSIVKMFNPKDPENYTRDIIISAFKLTDLKFNIQSPFIVCRQGVTDFFYNIISKKADHDMVGVSVTINDCPTNVPYESLLACDDIERYDMVHVYRDDDIYTMTDLINMKEYDKVLEESFKTYCDTLGVAGMAIYKDKSVHRGWCRSLVSLMKENNFMTDFNEMCGISGVDFDVEDWLIEQEPGIYTCTPELTLFLSLTYEVNIAKTSAIRFGYDVDIAEFNNDNYVLLRGLNSNIYIIVYTSEGEYLEKELEEKANTLSVSDKLRLSFYNKYINDINAN